MVSVALVLGGAETLEADVRAYTEAGGQWDGVVACNDAIAWWPEDLDAGVTLHPQYLEEGGRGGPGTPARAWRVARLNAGFPDARRYFCHRGPGKGCPDYVEQTPFEFYGQMRSASSGVFAAKVALVDLGFDTAVLCGVPLSPVPHVWGGRNWSVASEYFEAFKTVPEEYLSRLRSMSGRTRDLLGAPECVAKRPAETPARA